MSKLLWMVCFGLCCWISVSQAQYDISCRFKGVFQVEKGKRYNQTAEEARKTCADLDVVIATKEQVKVAMDSGFEICRYGWVDNNTVVIPRITPNKICANGYKGLYELHANLTTLYDVFCYNASDQTEKNCERYDYKNKSIASHDPTEEEGAYTESESSKVSPTHPGLDVGPTNIDQWAASEDVTTEPEMSTEQSEHSGDHGVPPEDGDIKNNETGEDCCTTDGDDLIAVDKHKNPEEGSAPGTDPSSHRNTGSYNGAYTVSESSKASLTHPGLDVGPTNNDQWTASEDVTTEPEMSTEQSEHSGDHGVPPEDGDIKNNGIGEDCCTTDGDDLIAVDSDEKHKNREEGSAPGTDPSSHRNTGSYNEFPDTHDDHPSDDDPEGVDSPIEDFAGSDKSGSTQSKQKRRAAIPDWLIVCVSLVCLGLIFSVCIALNARRICGQKKKLVINGNKGSPEDGVIMEQNGDTVKSQEMVQLVSKEQTNDLGDQDEPPNEDNIRNAKNVDMKIGV